MNEITKYKQRNSFCQISISTKSSRYGIRIRTISRGLPFIGASYFFMGYVLPCVAQHNKVLIVEVISNSFSLTITYSAIILWVSLCIASAPNILIIF
ncbi:Phenylcoumaran benzylic ether reductase [Dirofilaria immitis]